MSSSTGVKTCWFGLLSEFIIIRRVELGANFGIYEVGKKCQSECLVNFTAIWTEPYEPLYFGRHPIIAVVAVCQQGQCSKHVSNSMSDEFRYLHKRKFKFRFNHLSN